MKQIILLFAILVSGAASAQDLPKVFSQEPSTWTQSDCDTMIELWNEEYYVSNVALRACKACQTEMVDRKLNRVYQELIRLKKHNPKFVAALRQSEREWIKVRQAYMDMQYKDIYDGWAAGQSWIICGGNRFQELIENRIEFLELMLPSKNKYEEGDLCGSW